MTPEEQEFLNKRKRAVFDALLTDDRFSWLQDPYLCLEYLTDYVAERMTLQQIREFFPYAEAKLIAEELADLEDDDLDDDTLATTSQPTLAGVQPDLPF